MTPTQKAARKLAENNYQLSCLTPQERALLITPPQNPQDILAERLKNAKQAV